MVATGADYHEIGRVMSARISDDGRAVADIYIHDKGALQEIEDGTKELSLGYRCSLDSERFQRNTTLNHLSVVFRARCGPACALRTDALDATCPCKVASSVPAANMPSVKTADVTIGMSIALDEKSKQILSTLSQLTDEPEMIQPPVETEHADCACKNRAMPHNTGVPVMDLETLTKNLDAALAEVATLKATIAAGLTQAAKVDEDNKLAITQAELDRKKAEADVAKLTAEIETIKADAQAKVDAAQAARADADDAAFFAAVNARVDLLDDASKVGIENAKTLTDREIKVTVVKKVDNMDVEDTHSLDYVNGMYAGAMKRHTAAAASVAEVRTLIVENNDAADKAVGSDPLKTEAEISAAVEAKRKNRWR